MAASSVAATVNLLNPDRPGVFGVEMIPSKELLSCGLKLGAGFDRGGLRQYRRPFADRQFQAGWADIPESQLLSTRRFRT